MFFFWLCDVPEYFSFHFLLPSLYPHLRLGLAFLCSVLGDWNGFCSEPAARTHSTTVHTRKSPQLWVDAAPGQGLWLGKPSTGWNSIPTGPLSHENLCEQPARLNIVTPEVSPLLASCFSPFEASSSRVIFNNWNGVWALINQDGHWP